MSSYGGGNGYFFNNHHYVDLYPPQSLNVTSSPVIIKCEDQHTKVASTNNNNNLKNSIEQPVECNEKADVVIKKEEIDTNEHRPGDDNNEDAPEHAGPEVDIMINNVVASFNVRCHLNLRQIALNGANVEYRRENGVSKMAFSKQNYL